MPADDSGSCRSGRSISEYRDYTSKLDQFFVNVDELRSKRWRTSVPEDGSIRLRLDEGPSDLGNQQGWRAGLVCDDWLEGHTLRP